MVRYALCTGSDVKRIAGIDLPFQTFNDGDIGSFITDASNYVYSRYNPINRSTMLINSQATDAGSLQYRFVPDYSDAPAYVVGSLYISGSYWALSSGSFTVDSDRGTITFTSANFLGSFDEDVLGVEWVPAIYNQLTAAIAARDLISREYLTTGTEVATSRLNLADEIINRCKNVLQPKGAFMSTSGGLTGERRHKINNPFDHIDEFKF